MSDVRLSVEGRTYVSDAGLPVERRNSVSDAKAVC